MGTEESDDRKYFVRWPKLTLHILLCNQANSCRCGTKHETLCGLLTRTETSHSHSPLSQFPEPWNWTDTVYLKNLWAEKIKVCLSSFFENQPLCSYSGCQVLQTQWKVSYHRCGSGCWVWASAASDSPARRALISQSGVCTVMTSLMTDLLSGCFLHVCQTKRQVSAERSGLQGGLSHD